MDCSPGYSVAQMQRHLDEAFKWLKIGHWRYVKQLLGQTILSLDAHTLVWTCDDNEVCCGLGTDATDVVSKAAILVEAGKLWNRFLQFHRAEQCFRAVRAMMKNMHTANNGVPESITEIDIILCQIHTITYVGLADAAIALDLHPVIATIHGKECSLLCQRSCKMKGALMALLSWYKEALLMTEADIILNLPFMNSVGCEAQDSFQQCAMASLAASVLATSVPLREEDVDKTYSAAVEGWKDLGWPLDYTQTIIETLVDWECFCLVKKGKLDSKAVTATGHAVTILSDLCSQLWKFLGQQLLIARKLYYLLEDAFDMSLYSDAINYGRQGLKILGDNSVNEQAETTMWKGALFYRTGLAYSRTKEMSASMSCFKQSIPLLLSSSHNHSLMKSYKYLVMPNLAGSYEELAEILLDHCGSASESLGYRRKCLEYADYIDESRVVRAQALVADALHHQTAVFEQQGRLEEAAQVASEAEELFQKTVQGSNDSVFEYVVYGYFLFRRCKFLEAKRAMHQACINSEQIDSTVIFYSHEVAILTEELRFEVQHCESKRFTMPGLVVALYFRILCLIHLGSGHQEVETLVEEMSSTVLTYDYQACADLVDASMPHLKYGSFALLGYIYRTRHQFEKSLEAFRTAYESCSNEAAQLNIEQDKQELYSRQ